MLKSKLGQIGPVTYFTIMLFIGSILSFQVYAKSSFQIPLRYYTSKLAPLKEGADAYLNSIKSHSNLYDATQTVPIFNSSTPIVPFFPLAIRMNFDLVIGVKDQPYSMYEIIRVDLADARSIWFTLDSKIDGRQYIGLPNDLELRPIVEKMASMLGVQTYSADLHVKETISKTEKKMSVEFKRVDPDNEVSPRKIAFDVTIPTELDPDNAASDVNVPKSNKRQSHAMNHSASKILALIDIYKSANFFKLGKIKIVWRDQDSAVKIQKIFGLKVKSAIAQTIFGFSKGEISSPENKIPLKLLAQSLTQRIYRHEIMANERLVLQQIDYSFDLKQGKEELRKITAIDPVRNTKVAEVLFNPALPDMRFRLGSDIYKSRITISMDGEGTDIHSIAPLPTYFYGQVYVRNDESDKSTILEVRAGDDRKSIREQFKQTAEWLYERPLMTSLYSTQQGHFSLKSSTLAAEIKPQSKDFYIATRVQDIDYISEYLVRWQIRPHRMSAFKLKSANNLVSLELKGGTWGNGAEAADQTDMKVKKHLLTGKYLYQIQSRSYPMVQNLQNFPLDKNYFIDERATIENTINLQIKMDKELNGISIVPFLTGYQFSSNVTHKEIGVTINAFKLQIVDYYYDAVTGLLHVSIFAEKGFGPELTRPYAGPWRQNLEAYSGRIAVSLGIVAHSGIASRHEKNISQYNPFMVSRPGEMSNPIHKIEQGQSIDIENEQVTLLQGFSFEFLSPLSQGQRAARYLRSISISASPFIKPQEWNMKAENSGEIAWKTLTKYKLYGVQFEAK